MGRILPYMKWKVIKFMFQTTISIHFSHCATISYRISSDVMGTNRRNAAKSLKIWWNFLDLDPGAMWRWQIDCLGCCRGCLLIIEFSQSLRWNVSPLWTHNVLLSGKHSQCVIENGPVEIVDFPNLKMVIFQFAKRQFTSSRSCFMRTAWLCLKMGYPIGDIIFPHENDHEAINLPHETDTPKSMIPWIHILQYHIFISYSWLKSPVFVESTYGWMSHFSWSNQVKSPSIAGDFVVKPRPSTSPIFWGRQELCRSVSLLHLAVHDGSRAIRGEHQNCFFYMYTLEIFGTRSRYMWNIVKLYKYS